MSKYTELFNFFRTCPALGSLWSIGAEENIGVRVILPQGASDAVRYDEDIDVLGNYNCTVTPFPSVFEDYQINCYQYYDAGDSNEPEYNQNVLSLEEVQSICDWVEEQNELGNLPKITGERVVSIECVPRVPQIRYVNEQESTIGYFVTVRVRYVNRRKKKEIEIDNAETE